MVRKLYVYILIIALLPIISTAGILEDKVLYEQTLEMKVNKIIDEILTEDANRIVHAEVLLKPETAQKTKISYIQTQPPEEKSKLTGIIEENELEMPGITRKELLGPAEKIITEREIIKESPKPPTLYPKEEETITFVDVIARVLVSVYLDSKLSTEKFNFVSRVIQDALKLNTSRGDQLIIRRQEFDESIINTISKSYSRIAPLLTLLVLIAFLLVVLLSAVYILRPMKNLLATASSSLNLKLTEVIKQPTKPTGITAEFSELIGSNLPRDEFIADTLRPKSQHIASTVNIPDIPPADRPAFEFINETNIDKLAYILKNAPLEDIVLTCGYLTPEMVRRFLEALDDRRIEVFKRLLVPQEGDPQKVKQLEKTLRKKISFLFGGINHAIKILEECTDEEQNLLLKELQESDIEKFQQIRSQIILFEDIINAPEEVFVKIARVVGSPRRIGVCLCDLPQETITRIISLLRRNYPGFATAIEQFIERSKGLSKEYINTEKKNFVRIATDLRARGEIKL